MASTASTATTTTTLDQFRSALIASSVAGAGQRMSKQRKHFAAASDAASASYSRLVLEHNSAVDAQIANFGCVAAVSTPAIIRMPPGDDDDDDDQGNKNSSSGLPKFPIRESNPRVVVSCTVPAHGDGGGGESVAMGLDDGSVTVWDARDGTWKINGTEAPPGLFIRGSPVRGLAATKIGADDALLLASAHLNGTMVMWNLPSPLLSSAASDVAVTEIKPLLIVQNAHGQNTPLRRCVFSPVLHRKGDQQTAAVLATTGEDGTVRIWLCSSAASVECILCLANGHDPQLPSPSTSSSAAAGAALSASSQPQQHHPMPATRCVAFHPDGALVLVGDESGALSLWDLRDAARIWCSVGTRPLHSGRINAVAFSPNGFNFCSGGDDGLLYFFDLRKLAPPAPSTSAAAAASSSSVASASTSVTSHVFNFVWRIAAHSDAVTDIAFGPTLFRTFLAGDFVDAPLLFSCGLDGSAVALDAWTGGERWRSIPLPTHIPGPSVGRAPPSIRSISCVVHNNGGGDGRATSSAISAAAAVGDEAVLFNLVVMGREPQWRSYCPGGALVDVVKQVEGATVKILDAQQQQKQQQQQQLGVSQDDGGKEPDAQNEDDDSSDDDVFGQLKG